jgi:hypothetical protein
MVTVGMVVVLLLLVIVIACGSCSQCLFYQPLLPRLLADRRLLVLAVHEVVPVRLGFLPGDEFPERGDVQDHAVVEIGFEVEVRRPAELLLR